MVTSVKSSMQKGLVRMYWQHAATVPVIQSYLLPCLPAELRNQVLVISQQKHVLVLAVESAVWIPALKCAQNDILSWMQCHPKLKHINKLQFKVSVSAFKKPSIEKIKLKTRKKAISDNGIMALTQLADDIESKALADSINKLIKNSLYNEVN